MTADFAPHLLQEEKILWTGQPPQGFLWRPIEWVWFPACLGISALCIWGLFRMGETSDPLWLIGCSSCCWAPLLVLLPGGRFLWDRLRRSRTSYALTDRRILIRRGIFSLEVDAYDLSALSFLAFRENPDGAGTVLLRNPGITSGLLPGTWPQTFLWEYPALFLPEPAAPVWRMIEQARDAAVARRRAAEQKARTEPPPLPPGMN